MTIHVITGLPGSGKTTYARQKYPNLELFDDLSANPKDFDDFRFFLGNKNADCVVIDIPLIIEYIRQDFLKFIKRFKPQANIDWIFFSNNPEQSWKNIQGRDERKISEQYIYDCSKRYTILKGKKVIETYVRQEADCN